MTATTGDTLVTVHEEDALGIITLRRPERRNAMTRDLIRQLIAATAEVSDRDALRAVIIEAEGDTFSVGADLNEVEAMIKPPSLLRARKEAELGGQMMRSIRDIHQPTVCAVQGVATGGGACIAAACDFRVGAADCQAGLGEVRMAMNLMWHALPYFVDLLGPARAKQMLMSGALFPASTLANWGFLDETYDRQALAMTARTRAGTFVDLPPVAVQMMKRSINRYAQALGESVMHMDHDQWLLTASSADFQDALLAFSEKRKPNPRGH